MGSYRKELGPTGDVWLLAWPRTRLQPRLQGYPLGLAGEAISLAGRVVAIADVFDALTSFGF